MAIQTTSIGDAKLNLPDYQEYENSDSLHTAVKNEWGKISDYMRSRKFTQDALANSGSASFEHGFKCSFSELVCLLYLRNISTGELTRLDETTTPKLSDFNISATPSSETTQVRVQNFSGSSQNIALVVRHNGGVETYAFDLTNNQTSAANLSGVVFDKTKVKGVQICFDIFRKTDSVNYNESGTLYLSYNSETTTWQKSVVSVLDNSGVVLSITSDGQLQYTSSNLSGSNYEGKVRLTDVKRILL